MTGPQPRPRRCGVKARKARVNGDHQTAKEEQSIKRQQAKGGSSPRRQEKTSGNSGKKVTFRHPTTGKKRGSEKGGIGGERPTGIVGPAPQKQVHSFRPPSLGRLEGRKEKRDPQEKAEG